MCASATGTYDVDITDLDGRRIVRGMVILDAGVTEFVLSDR